MSRLRLRIKPGTLVGQDFRVFIWPGPYPAAVDTIFSAERSNQSLVCTAIGFGVLNGPRDGSHYGNGSLYIRPRQS